jgi:hypothetical protein
MRSCVVCGAPLEGRRSDARHCGPPCRAEASRLRQILNGSDAGPYRSIDDRLRARRVEPQANPTQKGPNGKKELRDSRT